jgi:hypothetical protein
MASRNLNGLRFLNFTNTLIQFIIFRAGIGDRSFLQYGQSGLISASEDASHRAGAFVPAIGTATIGGAGEAGQWRNRPVDKPHHLAQADRSSLLEKIMTTVASPTTSDQAGAPKVEEDLLKKAEGDLLCGGYISRLQGFVRPATRQRNKGFEGVSCFL